MVTVELGAGRAYACNGCGAVFLAQVHAARVRAGLDRTAPMLAERGAQQKPSVDPQRDTLPLSCPSCGVAMQPEWVRERQLRIDHCPLHGTFFDAHELAALVPRAPPEQPFFRPGGNLVGVQPVGDAMLELLGTILLGGG